MTGTVTRPRRPVVGWALVVIAVVHVLVTPLAAGDSFDSLVDGGLVGAVEADPAQETLRAYAFWYLTCGLALIALGVVVRSVERRTGATPRAAGWSLLAVAVWGVVALPLSPFWLLLVLAILALRAPTPAPA